MASGGSVNNFPSAWVCAFIDAKLDWQDEGENRAEPTYPGRRGRDQSRSHRLVELQRLATLPCCWRTLWNSRHDTTQRTLWHTAETYSVHHATKCLAMRCTLDRSDMHVSLSCRNPSFCRTGAHFPWTFDPFLGPLIRIFSPSPSLSLKPEVTWQCGVFETAFSWLLLCVV